MRVFICYARADGAEIAGQLHARLKELGADPWVDVESIPPGASWNRSIDTAIAACDVFVVVLTRAAVDSDDVEGEYLMALDEGKQVIPLLMDDVPLPRKLRGRQWLDARPDASDLAARLVERLGLVEARPPGQDQQDWPGESASPNGEAEPASDGTTSGGTIAWSVPAAVAALRRLANTEIEAVVFVAEDNTYVQFGMVSEGVAPYEAVSDQFHARPEPLTETQKSMLRARGFEERENWQQWIALGNENGFETFARHAIGTLEDVYGVCAEDVRIVLVGGGDN